MLVKITAKSVELSDCTLIRTGTWIIVIDKEDGPRILPYHWYVRRTFYNRYAYRKKIKNGTEFRIWMHRQITHCPNDKVVHHRNHNGLDNRSKNLELMTEQQHHQLHEFR